MDQLLEMVLQLQGKTKEEFNQEAIELRKKLLINQDVNSIGDVVSFLMENASSSGEVMNVILLHMAEQEQKIKELEAKVNG
ncbi:hypothetical protein [Cytobacillus horneckiae]|uniref:hypothetical protein n=1 Tax=Cytobacillus horneckiae TaxID=549687 RepID=UPI003D1D63DA